MKIDYVNKGAFAFMLVIFFFFSIGKTIAADSTYVNITAGVRKDSVLLRWAAASPSLWKKGKENGFVLVRYTVVRDGIILENPEIKQLGVFKPKPLNQWESIVQINDYAAIIAQALFGESFEVAGGKGLAEIINMSQDLEQRFAMSLYAADQDFSAACMAGWGFVDKNVQRNERYLYSIRIENVANEPASVFVATDEIVELPKAIGLTGIWGDKSVMLIWDYGMLKNYYNSYYVERSSDGSKFERLEGIPISNLNNKEKTASQRMYFSDSIPDNNKTYFYRIVGVSVFGEPGPPSEPISGKGLALLRYNPHIFTAKVIGESVEIEWEFEEAGNSLIKGFSLNQSDKSDRDFIPVLEGISPEKRKITYSHLNTTNYFTITAIAKEGASTTSFPILVQPIDSIPPSKPLGLTGIIDSIGVVSLHWKANQEVDLLGYKVFRAQSKGEELIQMFDSALKDTMYTDSIDIYNLNSKVYYAVAALDNRYNQSDLSEVLVLEKPDLIKPIPPLITEYRIEKEGIRINWKNSPDPLAVYHRVYRKIKSEEYEPEVLLKTISDFEETSYLDTAIVRNVRYIYTVRSLKKNFLESDASNSITLFSNKAKTNLLQLDRFDAIVDKTNRLLKLKWQDTLKDVNYYEVYKSEGNSKFTLWRTLGKGVKETLDTQLYVNTTYEYLIKAVFNDGTTSKSKLLSINY